MHIKGDCDSWSFATSRPMFEDPLKNPRGMKIVAFEFSALGRHVQVHLMFMGVEVR